MPYRCPFDLLANGRRIEVKTSRRGVRWQRFSLWRFSIHRHGILDEREVDFYVLHLRDVPEHTASIFLTVPAPLGCYLIQITLRSLMTRWGRFYVRRAPLGKVNPKLHAKMRTYYRTVNWP